jgi:diaminopimelate epimerase
MRKIKFTKMVASGNDFIVLEFSSSRVLEFKKLAQRICDRKYGIGADGMLVLEKSRKADIRMRIFNADGSEAEMCGNGARCTALYLGYKSQVTSHKLKIETKAGIIQAQVKGNNVRIKLTEPKNTRPDLPIKVNNRTLKVNFIDTGVPHAVIFASGLEKIDVSGLGRLIRYHKKFAPRGTNVDFVEVAGKNAINIRTYERGVEDETLACGTGSVAAALIFALKSGAANKVFVRTKSGEILSVYFKRTGNKFSDVWLEGKAGIVFKGEL